MATRWIKLHTKMLDWEWMDDPYTAHLFICCLLKAHPIETTWRNIIVPRGAFITSISKLSELSGMSVKSVRTALHHLITTGEVAQQTANNFSIITICNYDTYQSENKQGGKQSGTRTGTQTGKQVAREVATVLDSKEYKENNIPPISPKGGGENRKKRIAKHDPLHNVSDYSDRPQGVYVGTDMLANMKVENYPLYIDMISQQWYQDNYPEYKRDYEEYLKNKNQNTQQQ